LRGITESEFRTLYGQYRDPLFRFGYRLTGSVEVAEDLVHDCFVGLFRGAYDEGLGSMQTYLYSSMRNLCRKHYRDSGREELTDEPEESVTAGGQLEAIISREIAAAVQGAVARLPLFQREALILFEYEGLALDEISKVVEADTGAVKSRLHRARATLRKLLPAVREATR
jgi:RNA polymerase sigma-70 factor (ECF subfamily)